MPSACFALIIQSDSFCRRDSGHLSLNFLFHHEISVEQRLLMQSLNCFSTLTNALVICMCCFRAESE